MTNDLHERCFQLGRKIIVLTDHLPQKRSCWIISDQLIRSSTSIGANLIEARSSSSRLEFKRYNEIALRSANETRYWLRHLKEAQLSDPKTLAPLLMETEELAKMLASGIIKLKR